MANPLFLACDWGTSSFRLHLADRTSGRSLQVLRDSDGIKSLHDRFGNLADNDREAGFLSLLAGKIERLKHQSGRTLGGLPLIISGMASSSLGLRELPYAWLPLNLDRPELITERFAPSETLPHTLLLISGVRDREDIMRGEEVQMLGLGTRFRLDNCLCIMPGTHSKHLVLRDRQVTTFRTYMTGELFELLHSGSLIHEAVAHALPDSRKNIEAFKAGVLESTRKNLLNALFSIRAGSLLEGSEPTDNFLHLSGLIIGSELSSIPRDDIPVLLAGSGTIQRIYSLALETLEIPFQNAGEDRDWTVAGQACYMSLADQQ